MRRVALLFFFAGVHQQKRMSPTEKSPLAPPALEVLFRQSSSYAGIGARSTPQPVLILINQVAKVLADYGVILRSGGAPGADMAFERGCDCRGGKKEIFLPWKGFNKNRSSFFEPPETAEQIAAWIHPHWRAVKPRYRAFHARNVQQVYGLNLDNPVDFVLFWAEEKEGKVQGGTATAVHLAREMQIPTFNLWDQATLNQWRKVVTTHRQRKKIFWKNIFTWLDQKET